MSEREDFWIDCDGCGKESGRYGARHKALLEVKDEGWIVAGNFSYPKHYCPECQKQGKVPEVVPQVPA
jgi:hypothetical protein